MREKPYYGSVKSGAIYIERNHMKGAKPKQGREITTIERSHTRGEKPQLLSA